MPFDINDPETKAAVQQLVEDATAPLVAKNQQLLGEVKKLKKNSEIDPEAHAALENQVEELTGKLTEANKLIKNANTEAEKFKKLHESESAYTARMLVESGIRSELTKAGVTDPDFAETLLSKFAGSAKVEVNGDDRVITIGGKPLTDSITEWKATPAAAKFITAPANSGGGGQGGSQNPNSKTMKRDAFEALGPSEKSAFMKDGGKLTD